MFWRLVWEHVITHIIRCALHVECSLAVWSSMAGILLTPSCTTWSELSWGPTWRLFHSVREGHHLIIVLQRTLLVRSPMGPGETSLQGSIAQYHPLVQCV